jgi:predicted transcriptional regulator
MNEPFQPTVSIAHLLDDEVKGRLEEIAEETGRPVDVVLQNVVANLLLRERHANN